MSAMAQKHLFTGIVKDVQGDPIIGASVVEKNASNGSVTDLDGKFSVSTRRDDFETRVKNIGVGGNQLHGNGSRKRCNGTKAEIQMLPPSQ